MACECHQKDINIEKLKQELLEKKAIISELDDIMEHLADKIYDLGCNVYYCTGCYFISTDDTKVEKCKECDGYICEKCIVTNPDKSIICKYCNEDSSYENISDEETTDEETSDLSN